MAIALSDRIWNGDIGDPAFTNFITGNNAAFYHSRNQYAPWQNGTMYSGWAMLGRYMPACRIMLESVFNLVLSGQASGKLLGTKISPRRRYASAAIVFSIARRRE